MFPKPTPTDPNSSNADILILSNGPGEVSTWVRPVVQSLRHHLGVDRNQVRISLVLSPCSNASGQEVAIARRYGEIDRIQGAEHFFPFLLWGKTAESWDWHDRGVVIFLGGDQLFPIIIGKRLGYRTVIYGEWDTRWHQWGDRYAVMHERLIEQVATKYHHKFTVVGDLMADISSPSPTPPPPSPTPPPLIGLLPGSKPAKLTMGVPFCLAIAHHIHRQRPDVQFMIPVAPTITPQTLASYSQVGTNPWCAAINSPSASLELGNPAYLLTQALAHAPAEPSDQNGTAQNGIAQNGVKIHLQTEFPAYDHLRQCDLCITTIGANTAELGALGVPMIVLLPTQKMDAMRAWDGIPGLLANLPGVGRAMATLINVWFIRKKRLLAWPNIWAKEEIVPELLGQLDPSAIATQVIQYLDHPKLLQTMRNRLHAVRGKPGAGEHIAQIVKAELAGLAQLP